MAKALIVTLLFCIAVAADATTTAMTATTALPIPTTKVETSMPVSAATGQTETPLTGTPPTGTPLTGTPPTETPPTGTPPTGTPPTGTPLTGTPPTGTLPTETPPTGTPPTETPPTGTPPTGTPPTEGSSVSPNTGSSQTNPPSTAPVPATPKPPSACASNPCHGGSTCEERHSQSFACLCLTGDVYEGRLCQRANVFPGLLGLQTVYEGEMADKTSKIFNDTAESIITEISKKFSSENNGFLRCLVLELRENKANTRSQRQGGNVDALIEIIYGSAAEITIETVTNTMKDVVCDECGLAGSFTAKPLCESNPCETLSTRCTSTNGSFTCSCNNGYIATSYSDRLCMACPSGQKAENNKCTGCGFGYTGFNCKDKSLLIVVIVCCIIGFLLIVALIALPLVVKKFKKKSSKRKEEDIGKPYQSHSIAKAPLSYSNGNSNNFSASVKEPTNSLANFGAPRIPRATANSNWESRTNLEMTPSNSRQNLVPSGINSRFNDNQDDMYSYSQNQPKSHPYEEIQPKSNRYSQNRASNPYAQIRGQTNPYYN